MDFEAKAEMKPKDEERDRQMKDFEDKIRRAGVKRTPQRVEIFRELIRSRDHPDAETVYRAVRRRMPSVSLDTVYRTLWLFHDLGLVGTLGPRDRVRFDGNMKAHHHFICLKCGSTFDFYSEDFDCLNVPEEVKPLGRVEKTQVAFQGYCLRCLGESRKRPEKRKRRR